MAKIHMLARDADGREVDLHDEETDIPLETADEIYKVGSHLTFSEEDGTDHKCVILECRLDWADNRVDLVLELPESLRVR